MSRSFRSSRGSSTFPLYTVGGKMSNNNLKQRISIKFCVKIGKSASGTLAVLTLAHGEYAVKKWSAPAHGELRFREFLSKESIK
jgi:hypothetical protein